MNSPHAHPLFQKLLSLNLPPDDYAVFGSAPMWLYGLKDLGHDIDLVARGQAWEKAQEICPATPAGLGGEVVRLFDSEIEIFNIWVPGEWDVSKLIDEAQVIEGIRFVSLEDVLAWKKIFGRAKDFDHIKLIEEYLAQQAAGK